MKIFGCLRKALLLLGLILVIVDLAQAGPYLAYSLREAQIQLEKSGQPQPQVSELGGMTRLIGLVYDTNKKDLIVVGHANPKEKKVGLDDLVVALRCIWVYDKLPLVSLEKTDKSLQTGNHDVVFEGGIENTQFGHDFLEADIVLKRLALGLLPTDIWGFSSYFALAAKRAKEKKDEKVLNTRFWFFPIRRAVASREAVVVIRDLAVGVRTEMKSTSVGRKAALDLSQARNDIAEAFAQTMTDHYADISAGYHPVARIKTLLDLVAAANALKEMPQKPDMQYWLQQYRVAAVETKKEYPMLKQAEKFEVGGKTGIYEIEGGIEIKVLISRLTEDGDITALRDLVLLSRPAGNKLVWAVPLSGWQPPGGGEPIDAEAAMGPEAGRKVGCSFTERSYSPGDADSFKRMEPPAQSLPFSPSPPRFEMSDRLTPQRYSPQVGGVMLREVAKVAGGAGAQVDLSRGNFSLIVDGENARLAPEAFRKFITALWSVYYTEQDPGISIDPIERGGKKHLVRYIGSVVNNDLGRVMREADYIMKKWAVGTERPNLPGFKDVDALTARHGLHYLGASRRFWFVPEDMRFKRGGEMLLFDHGHMTLKTEYRLQDKGVKADPADEAFARFFTAKYSQIAAKYPVYQELFEYAQMVSLAKYLKEQGVPLYWFLMANKDLVLTEDSPGTVDALAKGSRHFAGIKIEGGVNLGFQGQYVYDQQAGQAISQAVARSRERRPEAVARAAPPEMAASQPTDPVSFAVGQKNFTAVPQHSLTSGRDRRGLRYQTDLALRQGKQPGLELVRYFNPQRQEAGEFGNGWHLLIPYRLKPGGEAKRKFLNAIIPEKMTLCNLISGEEEILTFSTDRYSIAGYVPEKLTKSQVVGLFLMANASYRLADKLGNEFWFDQAGFLTDMVFSKDHRIHLEYLRDLRDLLEYAAYRVKPADNERVDFLNARLPRRMQVTDQRSGDSQVLTFNAQGDRVGYVPQSGAGKYRFLALMTDASFRLLLQDGTVIPLDRTGAFAGKVSLPDHPLAKAISLGNQKISFTYTFGKTGNVLISQAYRHLCEKGAAPVCLAKYEYDDEGRLARVTSPQTGMAKAETLSSIPTILVQNLDHIQR